MSAITTHVLDVARGRPAAGIAVTLEHRGSDGQWRALGSGAANSDGRCSDLLSPGHNLEPGAYRLTFAVESYQRSHQSKSFYPEVSIVFQIDNPGEHYHVPLLLSPYGYSTYRGS